MQSAQSTVTNVVVRHIRTRMIQQPTDAVFRHTRCPTDRRIRPPERVVRQHSVPGEIVTPDVTDRPSKYPAFCVLREQPTAYFSCTPEATDHCSTKNKIKRPFLTELGLYDLNASTFQVEVLPFELHKSVATEPAQECEQVRLAMLLPRNFCTAAHQPGKSSAFRIGKS